ncbi:MAG: bacterioferritin, partial [bacterium]|nr:bacterioferritin [bacterium]
MHEKSIELLNQALADELSAVHQYMYFHFRLDDLGYQPLATLLKQTAIEEMQHAENLAERILFLGGEVEMEVKDPVQKIHDAKAMLEKAKAMEDESAKFYNRSALEC